MKLLLVPFIFVAGLIAGARTATSDHRPTAGV
jgi:hypothetical protein